MFDITAKWRWDPAKAGSNLRKHRISFEVGRQVLDDPLNVTTKDHHPDGGRWATIGIPAVGSTKVLVVVHTDAVMLADGMSIGRIISVRQATRHERGPMRGHRDELSPKLRAELEALEKMSDDDIDLSDAPEILDWSNAVRGKFARPVKRQITLRIDADLIDWFERGGSGYQTRINAALREWVATHQDRQKVEPAGPAIP